MINYYFSGVVSNYPWFSKWLIERIPHRLLSLHGSYTKYGEAWCNTLRDDCQHGIETLLFDSGAFTAWNTGHDMTLDELLPTYEKFVRAYESYAKEIWLISLDKIPGKPGVDPTPAEIDEAIAVSDRNHEVLVKNFGERVLPVFHQGESLGRLQDVCKLSKYICVSPRNDLHERQRVRWSREVHNKLPPGIRTHGLAATGVEMMTTVPWHSVDSATWLFIASTGTVILCLNGKMVNLAFSNESPNRFVHGQHYNTITSSERSAVDAYLGSHKFKAEDLASDATARFAMCALSIMQWVKNHHKFVIDDVPSLFDL